MRKYISSIKDMYRYPVDVQSKTFNYLLESGKQTIFGKDHHFGSVKNYDDFRRIVPVNDYHGLYSYVNRCIQGEQNVLWNKKIKWFSKSSGTTEEKSKFIPVSVEGLNICHYKVGAYTFASYFNNHPDSKITTGSLMSITGSLSQLSPNIMAGDVSAILAKNLDFWAKPFRSPSNDIALLPNWDEKLQKIRKKYVNKNVCGLVGVPSWGLLILKTILDEAGQDKIKQVWKNFELIVHGGVSFEPYKQEFSKILGNSVNYVETYNASEGYFAFQEQSGVDMLLATDNGVFYEFIPMKNINDEHPKAICLAEVELNKNYALVITTNSGLWRYKIGDTIQFTSLNPYRICITGRTKAFINAFGEELIVDNANQALKQTLEEAVANIKEFTAAPVYLGDGKKARHQWFIEFNDAPNDVERFADILDKNLQAINSDYEAKRKNDLILNRLELIIVPNGTFYEWLKRRGKLGGQYKVQRLSNDRRIADAILEILK
jgi:hypothetical protein